MGFLDSIKNKLLMWKYAPLLSGRRPIYRSRFGNDIYASDVVQQAIGCIVTEIKKLDPQHIIENGSDTAPANDRLNRILHNPNPTMTTSDFLEKIIWQLFLRYNSFIIPTYSKGKGMNNITGLYPIDPREVSFITDAADNLHVKFAFDNGYETTVRYSDVIHIKHKFSINEFMGGNEKGEPDLDVLLKTVQLNHNLLEGVSSAVESSFSINAVVKYNTMLDKGEMDNNIKELQDRLDANQSGFLPMDIKGEFIPLKKDIQLVDDKTLAFIDSKILRHFGVSLPIISGDYTKDQYEAFYQKTLEPLIISLSQAFTKALFSDTEWSYGNRVAFYSKELIFMNTQQKIEMIRLLGDAGSMYENEKRIAFGLRPLPELSGVRMQSLNYVNVDIADSYQLGDTGGSNE